MNYENLISIVMPVFNAQAYLEEALESVRRQTWTDWELPMQVCRMEISSPK